MASFLRDALDILRLRFKPLAHYVYPAWQPILWLLLIGIVGGLNAEEFHASLAEKIAFFVVLNTAEALLLTIWLMIWWRYVLKRPVEGSLFPLVVLVTSAQLLGLFTRVLPENPAILVSILLAFYGLYLLVAAIAASLEEKRGAVLLAILAYFPTVLGLFQVATSLAIKWGWIVLSLPSTGVR